MILLCDEDIGTKVPSALHLVGLRTVSMATRGWLGRPDTEWLTLAGQRSWLVFSSNKKMLRVPNERETIIRERVGIVFLTSGEEHLPKVLWLLLVKWPWLVRLDQTEPRPFAFLLSPTGRVEKQPL